MTLSRKVLAFGPLLFSPCWGINIATSNNANTLANALFNGPGITVLGGPAYSGASTSSGTFSNGPFGIGSGTIFTTGDAVGALPGGNNQVNNGGAGSPYCGSTASTSNAAVMAANIDLSVGYDGITIELILASEQPQAGTSDPIGVYLDNTLYSVDNNGNRINAGSNYLQQPDAIVPPDSDTLYSQSSPPLVFTIFTTPGTHTMVFAICNYMNRPYNSALMINAKGCVGDECYNEVNIDYVTTTTTVAANVATSTTSTIKASQTTSGTFIATVQAEPGTTTTEEPITTTDEGTTTTADIEDTTTTIASETTTTIAVEQSTTTTTVESDETTTTTGFTTTDTTETDTTFTSIDLTTTESTTATSDIGPTSIITTLTEQATNSITSTAQSTELSTSGQIEEQSTESSLTSSAQFTPSLSSTEQKTIIAPVTDTTTAEISVESQSTSSTEKMTEPSTTSTVASQETSSQKETDSSIDITMTVSMASTGTTEFQPSTTTGPATNERILGDYAFLGCLGSSENYPFFEEVTTDSEMTPELCVSLANGALYVGINRETCYQATSLTGTDRLATGRCDIRCPGDDSLYCGGIVDAFGRRRDVPSNLLLTLYGLIDDTTSLSVEPSLTSTGANGISSVEVSSEPTIGVPSETAAPTFVASETSIVSEPTEISQDVPTIPFSTAGSFPTFVFTKGYNYTVTKTAQASTVTTVTYITVNPTNPGNMVTTKVAVTLGYTPCNCANQVYPTVPMTTIVQPCNACGPNREHSITLTMPTAACKGQSHELEGSHRQPYSPQSPQKIENHKVYSQARPYLKSKPTEVPQAVSSPMDEDEGRKWHSPYEGFSKPPSVPAKPVSTLSNIDKAHPTYVEYPEGHNGFDVTKTWKTEASSITTNPSQEQETSKILDSAGPRYGPDSPVVVAEAGKYSTERWTTFTIVISFMLLFV